MSEAQSWRTRGSTEGDFAVLSLAFSISLIFPSMKVGGGPLIPCLLSLDLSPFGFPTRVLYKRDNNPTKPTNTMDVKNWESNWGCMTKELILGDFTSFPFFTQNWDSNNGILLRQPVALQICNKSTTWCGNIYYYSTMLLVIKILASCQIKPLSWK